MERTYGTNNRPPLLLGILHHRAARPSVQWGVELDREIGEEAEG